MSAPKLREGAEKLLAKWAVEYAKNDVTSFEPENEQAFLDGGLRVLANLHLLLEPREAPLVNGKRVAIVEVEE